MTPIINLIIYIVLILLSAVFVFPVLLVLLNSFKNKLYISTTPFALPDSVSFVGLKNYTDGLTKIHFLNSIGYSLFITVVSVGLIVLFCSMAAWMITRVKGVLSNILYYMFIVSMVVPFQMVMYTMTKIANMTHLDNFVGITILYLGFGAGMAVFMFSGFVKGVPLELEEAALIDGCSRWQTFWKIVFPLLKPTVATVAIIDAMAFWNDYLLPSLVLTDKEIYTIPIATQAFYGTYSTDIGLVMAALLLAMLPILILYLFLQKHIVAGVTAGAVKG